MNKLIILLPALLMAGSINIVNATNDEINKINIINDITKDDLPTDEEGIHNLISDKTKFEANKDKICDYIINCEEFDDTYIDEILELMINEAYKKDYDFINKLALDDKFIAMLTTHFGDYSDELLEDKCNDEDYKEAKQYVLDIFGNQYTLLRHIIMKSSIKDDIKMINNKIEIMFCAVSNNAIKDLLKDVNESGKHCDGFNEELPKFMLSFYTNIIESAKEDKEYGILVLQKILEYMYQEFYEPCKEFINSNFDSSKMSRLTKFMNEMFKDCKFISIKKTPEETEKYWNENYNMLLMLSIYNKLGIALVNEKLRKDDPNHSEMYVYDYNHIKKIFDIILELDKASDNKINRILISFYIKAIFMQYYNTEEESENNKKQDRIDIIDIMCNLFQEEKYQTIYNLIANYQINISNMINNYQICHKSEKEYIKNERYRVANIVDNDQYYLLGLEYDNDYYDDSKKLSLANIKLLRNFENMIPSLIDILPSTYSVLTSGKLCNTHGYTNKDFNWFYPEIVERRTKNIEDNCKLIKEACRKHSIASTRIEETGKCMKKNYNFL